MITICENQAVWDACLSECYYPFISYRYGWLKAYAAGMPQLSPLFIGKQKDDHSFEYICPIYIDRKHKELTNAVGVVPGFISHNVNPDEMLNYLIRVAQKEGLCRISLQIPPGYHYCNNLLKKGFELKRKIPFFVIKTADYHIFADYLGSIDRRRRQNIKAALGHGLRIDVGTYTPEIYQRFEKFLHELADRKNFALPNERLYAILNDYYPDAAAYWIATHEGVDVGSALTLDCQDQIWDMWLQEGGQYRNLRVNTFMYAEIIRYAISQRLRVVNFGTSPLDSTLAEFKRRSGGTPEFHELYELDLAVSSIAKKTLGVLKNYVRTKIVK